MATRTMNKVFLLGNLTRDPELRYTNNGAALCTFGIATNREWSPSNSDEIREATEFHEIVAWGKLGELCEQLLFKGRKVFIEGRLHTRTWEDSESDEKTMRTEIVCKEMIALEVPSSIREEREGKEGREGANSFKKSSPEVEPRPQSSEGVTDERGHSEEVGV